MRRLVTATFACLFVVAPALGSTLKDRYGDTAERIIAETMRENESWTKLLELCDDIGPRLSGSAALDEAIHWAARSLQDDGHENVRLEPVTVPHWVRGEESVELVAPRRAMMTMLGLGGSVGTPPEGITAEVEIVADEEELEALGEGVRGKIVLFNKKMPPYDPEHGAGYGGTVRYRAHGARLGAMHGAVGCLVRSVTAKSLNTPHTGGMRYGDAESRIPAAAITIEDAELIARFRARGIPVRVTMKMEAKTLEPKQSGNVVAELRGTERPDEVVIMSGHIDSWDTGTGAHDDGACCVMAMEALNVLRRLGLRPRRTLRVVLWTNEENGLAGGRTYAEVHANELDRHVAAIEADSGAFRPTGYHLDCADADKRARSIATLQEILDLSAPLGPLVAKAGYGGADIGPMKPAGVPLLGHRVEGSGYFDLHHTPADTVDKVDPDDLSRNVAMMAVTAYVLADMPDRLGEEK